MKEKKTKKYTEKEAREIWNFLEKWVKKDHEKVRREIIEKRNKCGLCGENCYVHVAEINITWYGKAWLRWDICEKCHNEIREKLSSLSRGKNEEKNT